MNKIRNLLAVIGFAAVILLIAAAIWARPIVTRFSEFDPKAFDVYWEMFETLLETGNAADSSVWKAKVKSGISLPELEETIRFIANQHNVKNIGELAVHESIQAATGKDHRLVKIYMFCDPLTGARLLEHSDSYSAYFPCRISLVEDKSGALWLYTLNIDAMIYGGLPLPPQIQAEARKIKAVMLDIMKRAAAGDF